MTEVQTQSTSTKRTVGLVIAAAVLIGGVVFGAVQLSGDSGSDVPSGGTSGQPKDDEARTLDGALPKAMGGQEAIDALGDKIGIVAERNNMTAEELKDLLLSDSSAYVSKTGIVGYKDPGAK